jgi:hypothetical protein
VLAKSVQWVLPSNTPLEVAEGEMFPKLPKHWIALGRAGWNLTWLDRVAENNQMPLQANESDAFLGLIRLLSSSQQVMEAWPPPDITPLKALADPRSACGKQVQWQVRIVRGAVVPLEKAEQREALGANHYYQFDGFVDIGNQRVRYQVGGEEISFEREFPITLVTYSDDSFVPVSQIAGGQLAWQIGKFAQVRGCFYRLWSYQSDLVQQNNPSARQAAPLVIVSSMSPTMPAVRPSSTSEVGWFGYALCVATLLILGAILYFSMRQDSRRPIARR